MSVTTSDAAIGRAFRLSFFFWITAIMAFFVFAGFGLTYWAPMASGRLDPMPPVVHLHGIFYSSWMVLLVAQSLLINTRRVALHRSIGTFGIAIATGVLLSGAMITLLFGDFDNPAGPEYHDLMYLGLAALVSFGILFTLAIRQVRVPEQHKRLILLATIPLLPPGINRLYMVSLGLTELPLLATYLTMDVLLAAILVHDWRRHGRLGFASIAGLVLILGQQLLHIPISGSETFADLCEFLTGLVYYR